MSTSHGSPVKRRSRVTKRVEEDGSAQGLSIFAEELLRVPVPRGFGQVVMSQYDGTQDPDEHVQEFMIRRS